MEWSDGKKDFSWVRRNKDGRKEEKKGYIKERVKRQRNDVKPGF